MTRPGWVLNPLLRGALVAAAAGLRVFPAHSPVTWPAPGTGDAGQDCSCQEDGCTAPGAHPRWLDWRTVATTDEDRLRAFWSDNPSANPAVVTGELADVLEVPAEAGERTAGRLARLATDLPIARSGSGTWQFYLRATGLPPSSPATAAPPSSSTRPASRASSSKPSRCSGPSARRAARGWPRRSSRCPDQGG
jgi:Bifunctional DNA primase/polymerase, N-terminal